MPEINEVIFSEITHADEAALTAALKIYEECFPINERHPVDVIHDRIKQGLSMVYVGRYEAKVVFMALLWPLKNTEFILLDYMATTGAYRGQNIGSNFLQSMRPDLQQKSKYLILEAEDPEHGLNVSQRLKRVDFYKRNGAKVLKDVKYILPAIQGTEYTDMILMIFPEYNNGKIARSLVTKLILQVYKELYNRDVTDGLFSLPEDENEYIELV